MPRGGGGGFRGGGFSGGGFRGGGGGFRGGGFSGGYRGGGRSSGRPFGRTGATRITSRSPSGPYSHRYNSLHRRYYRPSWWYHRPWYYRMWYNPMWSGYWHRPWYYSPVYIGGGIIFMIVLALIILPVAGLAFAFPFSDADAEGYVNYRSTELLYFNEFWYEYEYIEEGEDISFYVDSFTSVVTFAIWNGPFENLPTTIENINVGDSTSLTNNEYWYESLYLRQESVIEYEFNASSSINFFIANTYDFYSWDQGGSPSFHVNKEDINQSIGTFTVSFSGDYYIVWYNEGSTNVDVDYTINYIATDVIDFSGAFEVRESVTIVSQDTFTVPSKGNWYFFIYFDPMNSMDESTTVTFDVSYNTGVSSNERWLDIQWILIIVLVVVVIILIAAVLARKGQKKINLKAPASSTTKFTVQPSTQSTKQLSPYKTTVEKTPEKVKKCKRCKTPLKPETKFCHNCGGKIEGRIVGTTSLITPAKAKTCSLCGSKLLGAENFCKWCGTKIESQK